MKNLIAKLKNKIRKRFDEISFEDFLENTKKYSYEVKDKFKTKIKTCLLTLSLVEIGIYL